MLDIPEIFNLKCNQMSKTIQESTKLSAFQSANLEKEKLLEECNQLLEKIANHRYCLKLLINAKNAIEIIANYKPK